jgi:hypothetical protein
LKKADERTLALSLAAAGSILVAPVR